MFNIDDKIKNLIKNKKEKVDEIATSLLKELDSMDDWIVSYDDGINLRHKRFNLRVRICGITHADLLAPSNVDFPLKYRLKLKKKIKAIYHYNEFQTLSFVADVANGKYPFHIICRKIPEWLIENDPHAEGYITKGNIIYFTDESLAMAYKLAHD